MGKALIVRRGGGGGYKVGDTIPVENLKPDYEPLNTSVNLETTKIIYDQSSAVYNSLTQGMIYGVDEELDFIIIYKSSPSPSRLGKVSISLGEIIHLLENTAMSSFFYNEKDHILYCRDNSFGGLRAINAETFTDVFTKKEYRPIALSPNKEYLLITSGSYDSSSGTWEILHASTGESISSFSVDSCSSGNTIINNQGNIIRFANQGSSYLRNVSAEMYTSMGSIKSDWIKIYNYNSSSSYGYSEDNVSFSNDTTVVLTLEKIQDADSGYEYEKSIKVMNVDFSAKSITEKKTNQGRAIVGEVYTPQYINAYLCRYYSSYSSSFNNFYIYSPEDNKISSNFAALNQLNPVIDVVTDKKIYYRYSNQTCAAFTCSGINSYQIIK